LLRYGACSSGPRSLIYAQLLEVIKENDRLYLVFEFMETTLCRMLKSQHGPLSESMIRSLMYQCLKGVEVMHDFGFMHRDIKPENLLIAGSTIKLADFVSPYNVCT
jgi:serine/threonine protein kinase